MTEAQEYARAVDAGVYPTGPDVPIDIGLTDHRGEIANLLLTPITSVARITSKRGTVRANHYHRTDWHYTFVEHGTVFYFERAVGDDSVPAPRSFVSGEMFFTPPNIEHAMLFAEDCIIFTFAKNKRTHEEHESDVVRVDFVTPDIIAKYVP